MSFNAALSAGNLTSLRGDGTTPPRWHGKQFATLCNNTIIFKALVNQVSFTASFAQVTFDTVTTGAYTDIEIGQTVLIGSDPDPRKAIFRGRVRSTPTSTILYINETSAPITDNMNIWVLYDFAIHEILGREVSNVLKVDYDTSFRQLKPIVYGLKSDYIGVASGSPSGFTQRFQPGAVAATSGATISSYAFTIATGMTVTAGSASSNDVTIRFDAGEYWLKLVVTDSGGRTTTMRIYVRAVPSDFSSGVVLGFTGSQITGDLSTGFNATIEAFDGISAVYDNTKIILWTIEHYNGTETNIAGNIDFVGRLRNEVNTGQSDETYSYLTTTQFEIEGIGSQLARIYAPLLALRYKASPTLFGEITNLTIWRAIWFILSEFSTFTTLHSLQFDSTANTFLYPLLNTQGGNLLTAVNDLAQSINAQMQFAYDGRSEVVRDLRYESTANRSAAVTVADWTTQDAQDLRLSIDHMETVGKVEGAGGTFNTVQGTTTAAVKPLLAIAPGVAQGVGEGRNPLQRQILQATVTQPTAQSELNTRVGHHYAFSNPTDVLVITHLDGYHWLIPAVNQWYTWTLATSTNLRGRSYSTSQRWLCTSVSINHDNETGTRTVEATYSLETEGVAGQTVTYPPPATISTPISFIPPFDAYTSFPELPDNYLIDTTYPPIFQGNISQPPQVALTNGNTVMIWTGAQLWIALNYISTATPNWNEVTPTTGITPVDAQFIYGTKGAFVLVRGTGTWSEGFDFTSNNGGWSSYDSLVPSPTNRGASYVAATGWQQTDASKGFGIGYNVPNGTVLTSVAVSQVISNHAGQPGWVWLDATTGASDGNPKTDIFRANSRDANGTNSYTDSISYTMAHGTFAFLIDMLGSEPDSEVITVTAMTIQGTGVNPFSSLDTYAVYYTEDVFASSPVWTLGASISGSSVVMRQTNTPGELYLYESDGVKVYYSSDYGATFGAGLTVGTSPGDFGGFDTIKLGAASLAGRLGQVEVATTAGGAYGDYGSAMPTDAQPSCIHIPRYQFGGTTSNSNTSTPQYLVASDTPSSGGETMWKVTASGVTFTAITPTVSANDGLAVSPNCVHMPFTSGNRIAAILDFAGTRRLVVSTNAGAAWTDRGVVTSAADYIQYRKGENLFTQLFFADGASGPAYSGDHGLTIAHKSYPSTDSLVGLTVYAG